MQNAGRWHSASPAHHPVLLGRSPREGPSHFPAILKGTLAFPRSPLLSGPLRSVLGSRVPNLWAWEGQGHAAGSLNRPETTSPPARGKVDLHKPGPWCHKGWGSLLRCLGGQSRTEKPPPLYLPYSHTGAPPHSCAGLPAIPPTPDVPTPRLRLPFFSVPPGP